MITEKATLRFEKGDLTTVVLCFCFALNLTTYPLYQLPTLVKIKMASNAIRENQIILNWP